MTHPDRYITHCEGPGVFVATDREPKPVTVTLACRDGLEAGADVRVTADSFHMINWGSSVLEEVRVNGEGSVVVGHEAPTNWTEMTRGGDGPAGVAHRAVHLSGPEDAWGRPRAPGASLASARGLRRSPWAPPRPRTPRPGPRGGS